MHGMGASVGVSVGTGGGGGGAQAPSGQRGAGFGYHPDWPYNPVVLRMLEIDPQVFTRITTGGHDAINGPMLAVMRRAMIDLDYQGLTAGAASDPNPRWDSVLIHPIGAVSSAGAVHLAAAETNDLAKMEALAKTYWPYVVAVVRPVASEVASSPKRPLRVDSAALQRLIAMRRQQEAAPAAQRSMNLRVLQLPSATEERAGLPVWAWAGIAVVGVAVVAGGVYYYRSK